MTSIYFKLTTFASNIKHTYTVFSEINFEPFVEYHCGTLNSLMPNAWQSRDCGSTLPYICKKYLNHSDQEVTGK